MDFVGIPFQEKGRSRDGVDCWGLVRLIYSEKYGIELPAYTDLYSDTKDRIIGGVIDDNLAMSWVPVDSPQEGDIIVLRLMGQPFHVGMMLHGTMFIHAENGKGSVVENYKGTRWQKRVIGFYRLK